jgi:xanthine dehydrogenase accessory factor
LSHEILLRQFKLGSEDKPFVLVGVLRTDGPTAIKAGNKAIILADGSVDGWIGGHCTEDEIVRSALECLSEGTTRFLNLTTCQGGRMDVYLEPYLPKRRLIVFGHVPIVGALIHLAKSLNFSVTVVDKQASKEKSPDVDYVLNSLDNEHLQSLAKSGSQTYAVVATMGEFDLDHVTKLCALNLPYIGVVAGKKRASEIYSYLKSINIPEEQIERIKAPAGIYIRAVTAEEIALSIMAEIVEVARSQNSKDLRELARKVSAQTAGNANQISSEESSSDIMIDPICGMTVDGSSGFSSTVNGQTVFFCCASCKESFDSDPQKYIIAKSS